MQIKLIQWMFISWILLNIVLVSQAQDGNVVPTNNALIGGVGLGIGAIVMSIFAVMRQRRKPPIDLPQKNDVEATQEVEHNTNLPIPIELDQERLPVERVAGDVRPYLVLDMHKSANSFLSKGDQWVLTPDDMPYVIGSQIGVGLRIIDSYVSNEHIRIDFNHETRQYFFVDEGSSNGSRWDGDAMVKKRAYHVTGQRDVLLEIAVSYGFIVYIDEIKVDQTAEVYAVVPYDAHPTDDFDLPAQEALPKGVSANLNWVSSETKFERNVILEHTVTLIGRGDQVDAQVRHNLVSKIHAYLIWQDEQFWLLDKSLNGTWLTKASQGRLPVPQGEMVPLDADSSLVIEVARDAVLIDFHYSVDQAAFASETTITDKLPELPPGVRPLLHIVSDGDSEQRREIRLSTSIITIGRHEENIICLKRKSIAEYHTELSWDEGLFHIRDLSGMGTTIDGNLLVKSSEALNPNEIYQIRINEGRSSEVLLEFYYAIQPTIVEKAAEDDDDFDENHTKRIISG